MFQIIGKDVYFKEGKMIQWSHFGPVLAAFQTEEDNRFEIKKFDLEKGKYIHTNELLEFEIYGQVVSVNEGFAIAMSPEIEVKPVTGISNEEIMEKIQQQEQENLIRDELFLEQQLLLLNIDFNTSI